MTPRSLITLALRISGVIGVGQSVNADDLSDAFSQLNMMTTQWSQKRWLVYREYDIAAPCIGSGQFTIGPGGTFNTSRPDRIESAFVRTNGSSYAIDYDLDILEAREDWNTIAVKSIPGMPTLLFYDPQMPLGIVNIYPVPSPAYELHLSLKQPLTTLTSIDMDMGLPPEYDEALLYNLAVRLAPSYQIQIMPEVRALATATLNTVRNSNAQVSLLRMPSNLPGMAYMGGGGPGGSAGGVGPISTATAFFPAGSTLSGIGTLAPGAAGIGLLEGMAVSVGSVLNTFYLGTTFLAGSAAAIHPILAPIPASTLNVATLNTFHLA